VNNTLKHQSRKLYKVDAETALRMWNEEKRLRNRDPFSGLPSGRAPSIVRAEKLVNQNTARIYHHRSGATDGRLWQV